MKEIDAVILANGDYPSATLPLQILKKAESRKGKNREKKIVGCKILCTFAGYV